MRYVLGPSYEFDAVPGFIEPPVPEPIHYKGDKIPIASQCDQDGKRAVGFLTEPYNHDELAEPVAKWIVAIPLNASEPRPDGVAYLKSGNPVVCTNSTEPVKLDVPYGGRCRVQVILEFDDDPLYYLGS